MKTEFRIVFTREGLEQEETPPMNLPKEFVEEVAGRYREWADDVWIESRTVTNWVREPSMNAGEEPFYCTSCHHPRGYHLSGLGCTMPLNYLGSPVGPKEHAVKGCGCTAGVDVGCGTGAAGV